MELRRRGRRDGDGEARVREEGVPHGAEQARQRRGAAPRERRGEAVFRQAHCAVRRGRWPPRADPSGESLLQFGLTLLAFREFGLC